MIEYDKIVEKYKDYLNRVVKFLTPAQISLGDARQVSNSLKEIFELYDNCYVIELREKLANLILVLYPLTFSPSYKVLLERKEGFQPPLISPTENIPFCGESKILNGRIDQSMPPMAYAWEKLKYKDIPFGSPNPGSGNGIVLVGMILKLQERLASIFKTLEGTSNLDGEMFAEAGMGSRRSYDIFRTGPKTWIKEFDARPPELSKLSHKEHISSLLSQIFVLWIVSNVYTVDYDKHFVDKVPSQFINRPGINQKDLGLYQAEARENHLLYFTISVMAGSGFLEYDEEPLLHLYLSGRFPVSHPYPSYQNRSQKFQEMKISFKELFKNFNRYTGATSNQFDVAVLDGIDEFCNQFWNISEIIQNGSNS